MAEEIERGCPIVDDADEAGDPDAANPNLVSREAGQVPSDDGVGERVRRYRLLRS